MLGLTTLICSILLGSMVFFVGVVLPCINKTLDDSKTLTLTRHLFAGFYLWGLGLSLLAIGFTLAVVSYNFILLIVIFIGFLYSRQILLRKISVAKDAWLNSDSPQDKARFRKLHKRSVIISATQIVLLVLIIVVNSTQIL